MTRQHYTCKVCDEPYTTDSDFHDETGQTCGDCVSRLPINKKGMTPTPKAEDELSKIIEKFESVQKKLESLEKDVQLTNDSKEHGSFKEDPIQYNDGTVRLGEDWDDKWESCNVERHEKIESEISSLKQQLEKAEAEKKEAFEAGFAACLKWDEKAATRPEYSDYLKQRKEEMGREHHACRECEALYCCDDETHEATKGICNNCEDKMTKESKIEEIDIHQIIYREFDDLIANHCKQFRSGYFMQARDRIFKALDERDKQQRKLGFEAAREKTEVQNDKYITLKDLEDES